MYTFSKGLLLNPKIFFCLVFIFNVFKKISFTTISFTDDGSCTKRF